MNDDGRSAYRWRVACDVRYPAGRHIYERWWTRKDQSARVAQAEFCWQGGLLPDRCSFGKRRLVLEGIVECRSAAAAQDQALSVAMWALGSMYGVDEYRDPRYRVDPPGLDVRVRHADERMADTLADTGPPVE